ncbi:hypothetical protein SpCBS45565_g04312 [Spizellomyces sp. 'palustris']|nr:hypothetical protein SpCBS45565_g04312 [Spizellomyces sp. 'palustris']
MTSEEPLTTTQEPATNSSTKTIPVEAETMDAQEPEVAGSSFEDFEDEQEDLPSIEEAILMLETGEKFIIEKQYEYAAEELSRAVSALSAHYGDGAPECADALYLYGRALYFLAVEKSSVFGKSGVEDKVQDPDEMAAAALKELAEKASRFIFEGDGAENVEQVPAQEADEDAEDMEIAYEALTVAATAYQNVDSEASNRRLADVYLLIGHYHLEGDRPREALEEYKKTLEIREKYPEIGHRELAEARYYVALTLEGTGQYPQALDEVKRAMTDMSKRLEELKAIKAEDQSSKGKAPATTPHVDPSEEIKELTEMITDLEAKVEELNTKMSAVHKVVEEATEFIPTPELKKEDGPVTDISSLVKKRKAPEATTENGDSKKNKLNAAEAKQETESLDSKAAGETKVEEAAKDEGA